MSQCFLFEFPYLTVVVIVVVCLFVLLLLLCAGAEFSDGEVLQQREGHGS